MHTTFATTSPTRLKFAAVGLLALGLVAGSLTGPASASGTHQAADAAASSSYIAGRVLSADGTPAVGKVVEAEPTGDTSVTVKRDTTDSKGRYRIGGLPEGTYAPVVLDSQSPGTRQYLGGSTDIYLALTVSVSGASSTVTREFRLGKRAAATGILKKVSGAVAPNVTVVAQQLDGTTTLERDFNSKKTVKTNSKGVYKFSNLNPGSYTLTFGTSTTSAGSPVEVSLRLPAGTTTRNVKLKTATPPASTPPADAGEPSAADVAPPTISAPDGLDIGNVLRSVTDYPGLDPEQSRYQWFRDGRPVLFATKRNRGIQEADAGGIYTFQFSGVANGEPIGPIMSEPSDVVRGYPADEPLDTLDIEGGRYPGGRLSAYEYPGPKSTTYEYQWYLNGYELVGETNKYYYPKIRDVGQTVSVGREEFHNGVHYISLGSYGAAITKGKALKLGSARMLVNGKAGKSLHLGSTLSAPLSGLPKDAVSVAYQWQVDRGYGWRAIAGANNSTLTLSKTSSTTSHVGYKYRVVTTVERSAYAAAKPVASTSKTAVKK